MHHPRRWNVTTSMVGLKNSHIRKNLTQIGEPQIYVAGERRSSATFGRVWQFVKLTWSICSSYTLASCWDVKQPTNNKSIHKLKMRKFLLSSLYSSGFFFSFVCAHGPILFPYEMYVKCLFVNWCWSECKAKTDWWWQCCFVSWKGNRGMEEEVNLLLSALFLII